MGADGHEQVERATQVELEELVVCIATRSERSAEVKDGIYSNGSSSNGS
jgi:hypothetical protein